MITIGKCVFKSNVEMNGTKNKPILITGKGSVAILNPDKLSFLGDYIDIIKSNRSNLYNNYYYDPLFLLGFSLLNPHIHFNINYYDDNTGIETELNKEIEQLRNDILNLQKIDSYTENIFNTNMICKDKAESSCEYLRKISECKSIENILSKYLISSEDGITSDERIEIIKKNFSNEYIQNFLNYGERDIVYTQIIKIEPINISISLDVDFGKIVSKIFISVSKKF